MSCNKVGHIAARCLDRDDKDDERDRKHKNKREDRGYRRYKDYKEKGKKSFSIVEEETNTDSNDFEIEVVYVSMKDESDKDEKIELISYVNKNDKWIIDTGCLTLT